MTAFQNEVRLKAGPWQASILPEFGMNLISLRCADRPILREAADAAALAAEPHVYGIPLLFPANRTAGGRFEFAGKIWQLPISEPALGNNLHGELYNAPFQVTRQTAQEIAATYENTGARYPFPFRITITDTLSEIGLRRTLSLQNTGPGALPYTLAFHTTFNEPRSFCVPIGKRAERSKNLIPTGKWERLSKAEEQYRSGASSGRYAISGFYTAEGHRAQLDDIVFEVSANFDQWVLFNGGGHQGFLCIEPQCGQVNGLNTPNGHRILMPGQTEMYSIAIYIQNGGYNENHRH